MVPGLYFQLRQPVQLCLLLDVPGFWTQFVASSWSTVMRLLSEWNASLLCSTWQVPVSLPFWFMDPTATKSGTGWFSRAANKMKIQKSERQKSYRQRSLPLVLFLFLFSILKPSAELSFPLTLCCIPVSLKYSKYLFVHSAMKLWLFQMDFSINAVPCSQVWIASKQSAWEEPLRCCLTLRSSVAVRSSASYEVLQEVLLNPQTHVSFYQVFFQCS